MWKIWIDTGGTFTDGMATDPDGNLHRTKVLSSSRLRARLLPSGNAFRLEAPWLQAPIFDGYGLRVLETGETATVINLDSGGNLLLDNTLQLPSPVTVELYSDEEAPVLAARLLTQTPLNQPFPPLEMRLGTTRGTNALLERKGGRVALVVTKGFRDLLKIGTQQRPDLFQLAIPPADVVYETVRELDERMAADGKPVLPLSDQSINQLLDELALANPDVVAVSLLNAYRNPVHEQQVGDALRKAGFTVTLSHEISTAIQYVPRTQTTVVDAYLKPVLRAYLNNLTRQLGGHPVRVMTSGGGLVKADLFQPKDSLLSGPAGGVIGAGHIANELSVNRTLTLDMGGTSTDVARFDGRVDYQFTTKVGSFELQSPSLAVETVAAGGGSVCWYDGQLRVGPQSAGALPGPACYGAGGPLTITDINLLLGRLHPALFGIPVTPEKARAALETVRQQMERQTGLPVDEEQLLLGFERIANETMAGAIRKISVARGFDPKEYALLVFGGAGGLHGCAVAQLLGIQIVILPFDGGLLSAYGIGQARIERMAAGQVLQPLTEAAPNLVSRIDELIQKATDDLRRDIGTATPVEISNVLLFMRLQGQESTLEIPYPQAQIHTPSGAVYPVERLFQERYQQLYGHFPANRSIEVESIRVIVSSAKPGLPNGPSTAVVVPVKPSFFAGDIPVYEWMHLQEGNYFSGPALLLNTTSSSFLAAGWDVTVGSNRNAVARFVGQAETVDVPLLEAAQTELFARRFVAIAEEMGAQLQRTAFSVNVKERLDFSCALLNAKAELLVNAPHIPVHLGSLGVCARLVLEKLPLKPGDVVITNHPRYGGSHLPDVTLLAGVYTDEGALIGYVINRAHHAEIGGKVPGSMPPDATRLVEEGVVLEPQYIVKNGQFLWEDVQKRFEEALFPTRSLAENRADIEAALASLRTGETALRELVRQHGLPTVQHYMKRLQQSATDALKTVLSRYEGQTFSAEERLDDGHRICAKIVVKSQTITFDFSGTSPVHPTNLNANVSILNSAILYVLRLWCGPRLVGPDIPLNEGLMAPVALHLPECFLNPVFPDDPAECPAVVGGNTEVSQRLVDTLLKALGLAACSQGTMNNFLFGNGQFGYYETIGGGAGAGDGFAGRSAVHQHMTNTKLTDPEELERRYPVRLHQFVIREGSGGAGTWRGGDGIIREIEFFEPVQATLLSQHRNEAPYGLAGGAAGQTGQQTLIDRNGNETVLPGIFTRPMQPGERIRIETPGGGGWGGKS
ncbi:5-oxoprolinase (ATP-hydrolysing) [Larkinella arboricola]|uniref:5-oxoprolinase (ATP-hydrolysing) n=1 Tax=Larkinella arboricola TaxID=643671 RepID=A0A327X1X5_LARAB|nr:hydantoinase B/oxoprolinase family protein [Larkinella arboricola]RAK00388.1 5-oxoprolinase (ATP-hydrolysing) [Larkinella arboricola]